MKTTTLLSIISLTLFINGVVTDESVSVMVGDTVTLHTGIVIQSQDVIEWRFGVEQDLIAKINREAKTEKLFNGTDEIFRDRLKMNNQTGDLTITNITTQHSGLYHLDITGQMFTTKPFSVSCVFGDEVKSVSLLEGDSVTLHIDITDIKKFDLIRWRFHHESSPQAEFNRKAGNFPKYVSDGRFRDKLQLNVQTGSLNIKNIRTNHSGLYEVEITSSSGSFTIHQSFTVTVSGEVQSLSVMEGDSVTLHIDTKLQRDDLIEWIFGPQETLVARINKTANVTSVYPNDLNGRFRDRLRLNNQTGDLTITNIRTENFGLYELKMSSKIRSIYRRLIVNVSERDKQEQSSGLSAGAIIGFCVLAFLLVAGVVGVIIYRFPIAKTPEVTEGKQVILHTDLTILQSNHVIKWRFGEQKIAEIKRSNDTKHVYNDVLNGKFEGRLALRDESGSLIINDTRTTDNGVYKLKITSGRKTSYKRFKLTVKENKISVNEEETASLKTKLNEIQRDDLIEWRFEETLIAKINPANNIFSTYDGVDDLFRGKLELNHQTGDLNINDIRQECTGVYKLKIIRDGETSYRRFRVYVTGQVSDSVRMSLLNGNAQQQ